jgi:hypothetical protein
MVRILSEPHHRMQERKGFRVQGTVPERLALTILGFRILISMFRFQRRSVTEPRTLFLNPLLLASALIASDHTDMLLRIAV